MLESDVTHLCLELAKKCVYADLNLLFIYFDFELFGNMCDKRGITLIRSITKIAYITFNVQQAFQALNKLQQTAVEQDEEVQAEDISMQHDTEHVQHKEEISMQPATDLMQHKELQAVNTEHVQPDTEPKQHNELQAVNTEDGTELCYIMQQQQAYDFAKASRMSVESYEILKTLLYDKMTASAHVVHWQTRLDITILYLAHGLDSKTLANAYKICEYHITRVIGSTTDIMRAELQDICLKPATDSDWLDLAAQMSGSTDLKHCLGAIETTPIIIQTEQQQQILNLQLSCNQDLCFTYLNIKLKSKKAHVKPICIDQLPETDANCELPYYFVSSDRLSLGDCILQTYNEPAVGDKRKLFNLHANKFIANVHIALCILQQRWKFFANWKISSVFKQAVKHIKACILLHNFLILQQDAEYFVDTTTNRNALLLMHKDKQETQTEFIPTTASTELRSQLINKLFP